MENLAQRIKQELTRDKKKAVILAILLAVGLVVVGRLVLSGGASPAKATAKTASARAASAAAAKAGPAAREGIELLTSTVQADPERDQYLKRLDTTIARDLFEASEAVFGAAPEGSRPRCPRGESADTVTRRGEVEKASASLRLQSTVVSASPTAIINDQVLRVGEQIEGFIVVAILPRSCVVEKDSIQLMLEMR